MANQGSLPKPLKISMYQPVLQAKRDEDNPEFGWKWKEVQKFHSSNVLYVNLGELSDDLEVCKVIASYLVLTAADIAKKEPRLAGKKISTLFDINVPIRNDGTTNGAMYLYVESRECFNILIGKEFDGKKRFAKVAFTEDEIKESRERGWELGSGQKDILGEKIEEFRLVELPGYMGSLSVEIPERLRSKIRKRILEKDPFIITTKGESELEKKVPREQLVTYFQSFAPVRDGLSTHIIQGTVLKSNNWVKPDMVHSIMKKYSTSTTTTSCIDKNGQSVQCLKYPIVKLKDGGDPKYNVMEVEFDPKTGDAFFALQMKLRLHMNVTLKSGKNLNVAIFFRLKEVNQ